MNRRIVRFAKTGSTTSERPAGSWVCLVGAITMLVFLCCCSRHAPTKATPKSSPMADSISFQYAVYLVPRRSTQNVDPLGALADVLKKFPGVKVVDEIPERLEPGEFIDVKSPFKTEDGG